MTICDTMIDQLLRSKCKPNMGVSLAIVCNEAVLLPALDIKESRASVIKDKEFLMRGGNQTVV